MSQVMLGRVRIAQFYAVRDQRTRASAIRSHERRRLRSSASAAAANAFAGIAVSRASTAWLSRISTFFVSSTKRTCQRSAATVVLLEVAVNQQEGQLERLSEADELELGGRPTALP